MKVQSRSFQHQVGQSFLARCMECRRGLAMRIVSVRLSVHPSVTRVYCDKTVERSVQIYNHTKEHLS